MKPAIIAHRGASGVAPENTMLAFWTAVSSHADMIELDVQITKDKKAVIFHDRSFERITGESQGVADYTLAEIEKKEVGSWKDESFVNVKIPTLVEVLQELPNDYSLVVEVKPQNRNIEMDRSLEKLILNNLDDNRGKRGLGKGYISVRDEATYEWFKNNSNKYSIGLMQKKRSVDEFFSIVASYNIEFSQIRWRNYSEQDFTNLKQLGTNIIIFYADFPSEWEYLINQNIDGILTNYPEMLSGYLKQRKISD